MEKDECVNYELERDSNFCTHFTGDIFHTYHITKCYKYCSYCEAKDFMQNDEPLKSVHRMMEQKVRKLNLSRNNKDFCNIKTSKYKIIGA